MSTTRHETPAAAPAPAIDEARVAFPRGAGRLTLRAGDTGADLLAARFSGPRPTVTIDGADVAITYPRIGLGRPRAEVVLSREAAWEVSLAGVAWMGADLTGLALLGLEVAGGASHVELSLPGPRGVVPIRIRGGVSDLVLHRPAGTAATLTVSGGVRRLGFAGQSFGAVGGGLALSTPGAPDAPDRYEITIGGGVSGLADIAA